MEQEKNDTEAERPKQDKTKEEIAVVLDFLPNGYPYDDRPMYMKNAVAQAVGREHFILLELVPKKGIHLQPFEEVYIGEGKRDKIRFIRGQLEYRDLTSMAKNMLPEMVEKLVRKNEQRFVEFFNKGTIVTPRMHQFQLLPGVGKKHMMDILDERSKKPFISFTEISERVKLFPDPVKTIVRRVLQELEGEEKYYLFAMRQRKMEMGRF